MFGQCPLHRFLLLRRIFRASPVKECAEFILFLFAARAAQREKVKCVVLTFSAIYDFVRNPILQFYKIARNTFPLLIKAVGFATPCSEKANTLPQNCGKHLIDRVAAQPAFHFGKFDGDDFGNAFFFHGDAEQAVRLFHGRLAVRDDDKLRFFGKLL